MNPGDNQTIRNKQSHNHTITISWYKSWRQSHNKQTIKISITQSQSPDTNSGYNHTTNKPSQSRSHNPNRQQLSHNPNTQKTNRQSQSPNIDPGNNHTITTNNDHTIKIHNKQSYNPYLSHTITISITNNHNHTIPITWYKSWRQSHNKLTIKITITQFQYTTTITQSQSPDINPGDNHTITNRQTITQQTNNHNHLI